MQEVMQYMKIMFASLGCDKNLVDTENMLGILNDKGFEFTDDETQADVIVVNTCCFIGDAKQESINTILEMAQHKEDAVCKALIVTGCLAHRYKDEIIKEIPEVDAFLGTTSYDKIAEVVTSVLEGKGFNVVDDANRLPIVKEKRIITTPGYFEYLKIAEGCDKHCTYFALRSMNSLLGSTLSPIKIVKISSAIAASSISTRSIIRVSGFIVVSHNCSESISPRPL